MSVEFLDGAFEKAGSLDRGELLRVLQAHGAPAELTTLVERRVPAGVRLRSAEELWTLLPEAGPGGDGRLLQIGEVAQRVGLSLRSVRYYEEIGLVEPSARTEGGFRLYSEEDVRRLLLVKRIKSLRVSLEEMSDILATIDEAERADELDDEALDRLVVRLQLVSERADDRIARLERDLEGARQLRLDLSELLGRSRSAPRRRGLEA